RQQPAVGTMHVIADGLVQRIEAGLKPVEGKNRNDEATDAGQSEAAEHCPSVRFMDHRFHLLADGPVLLRARLGRRSPPAWVKDSLPPCLRLRDQRAKNGAGSDPLNRPYNEPAPR